MIDKTDKKIIKELREDSRQTIKELSKKTTVRPSTVHSRIQKLIKEEVIEKFTVKLNNKKVGESFIVFILVHSQKEIPNRYFRKDVVKEAFGITGEHDLLLKCKFSDIEEFNDFILDFRKIPEVDNTITMISTTTIKEEL